MSRRLLPALRLDHRAVLGRTHLPEQARWSTAVVASTPNASSSKTTLATWLLARDAKNHSVPLATFRRALSTQPSSSHAYTTTLHLLEDLALAFSAALTKSQIST